MPSTTFFSWPRLGIFSRLMIAFLVVALLPLVAFWQYERIRQIQDGEANAQIHLRLFSDRVVQQVNDWTRENIAVMQVAASSSEAMSDDPMVQQELVRSVAQRLPWAYLIHSIGLDGLNTARSDGLALDSYEFRHYFRAVAAGQPFAAEVQIGKTLRKPAFLMSVPIRDGAGRLHGVLALAAALDEMSKAVTSASLGRTGFAFLLTPEGRLIADGRDTVSDSLQDYSAHPAFRTAIEGKQGLTSYTVGGIKRIAVIRRTSLDWIAVAQQDADESFAATHAASRDALALVVVTAILVSLISFAIARGFASPIEKVTSIAHKIREGDLDFALSTDRTDQIGDLIRAMHEVRATLQQFVDAEREIIAQHQLGDMDFKMDGARFQGVYREMAEGVNDLVSDQVTLAMIMRDAVEHYAVGDFSVRLPRLPGKKGLITQSTEKARDNLIRMQEQIVRLVEAAAKGRFSERGDEQPFQNAFREMVIHLNHLMQTAESGLRELARLLAAVAQGDLTVTMDGHHEGTFAQLQRDTNATVFALGELIRKREFDQGLLRATLEHLPQGVSVVDSSQRLIAWNQQYLRMFGYPEKLVYVGQRIEVLMRHNFEKGWLDSEEEIERRLRHLRQGTVHTRERELPSGMVLSIRGTPVPGVGYVTSYADVTQYKRVEAELRALTETLERRVLERTADHRRASAEANRANQAKSRFLAAAVHDLAQPMNAARLYLSAVKDDLQGHTALDLATQAERSLASVDGIFSSLMDISRLESGSLAIKMESVSLDLLFQSLEREFTIGAAANGLELRFMRSKYSVHSDEVLLQRILQNLLSNAVRYTPSGGRIVVGARKRGKQCSIEVWDTGYGIADGEKETIFEEFRRLGSGQNGTERGAGLGLAIVRTIAKLLDHEIAVKSVLGRGSVFAVKASISTCPGAIVADVVNVPKSTRLAGQNVWCVDDDRSVREAMRTVLERWGCSVTVCENVSHCIQLARRAAVPDLIIVDYQLGDGTGPALVAKLHEIWRHEVAVIVVSGEHGELLQAALHDAPWPVMTKPIRPDELRAAVTLALLDTTA